MTNETNLLKRKIPVNNDNGEFSNHSAEEENEEEVMFIKQVKLEPQNHRHPVKLQSDRVLRPYQEQCIKDMRKLELANTEQERNIFGGSYAVQRKAHCGMLASKVGSGKTMMVIKFIEYFGTTPHRRTTMASSFMHTDSIHMTYYRVNLVVVPNALTKQWGDEIAQCGMSKKFLWFDSASKLNEFYNEIQYVRHDEDEDEEEGGGGGDFFLNVLVSSSFYDALGHCRVLPDGAGLVNKTTAENRHLPKFNSHNMFMRIFFDEADAKNPVIIYADFIWLISATLLFTIQQSQTKFGSSKRRDTMFGALKLANRFFNIEQLCIKTPDEVVDTQCKLMPVDSFKFTMRKSFMDSFWAQIESNHDDNLAMNESFDNINTWYTQIANRLDKSGLLNSIKHVTRYSDFCLRVNRLNHMTTDVLREIETILGGKEAKRIREEEEDGEEAMTIFVVYYTSQDLTAYIDLSTSIVEKTGIFPTYWVDTNSLDKHIAAAHDKYMNGKNNIIFMNGNLIQTGLNLNWATHLILIGHIPKSSAAQLYGRFQRPPRNCPLRIVRILTLVTPLICNSNSKWLVKEVDFFKKYLIDNTWSSEAEEQLNDLMVSFFFSNREQTKSMAFHNFKAF